MGSSLAEGAGSTERTDPGRGPGLVVDAGLAACGLAGDGDKDASGLEVDRSEDVAPVDATTVGA